MPLNAQDVLTPAQYKVWRVARTGATNREIATALGIAPSTVRVHMMAILRALGTTRIKLVMDK